MELEKIIEMVESDYKIFTSAESRKIVENYCYALDKDNGKKEIYVFIGPSGSGKSTFIANMYDSNLLDLPYINRFVFNEQNNANTTLDEEIFTKLNLAKYGRSFVLETSCMDSSNIKFYNKLKKLGYTLNIFIMATKDININLRNIKQRAVEGGHEVSRERLDKDNKSFFKYFAKVCSIGTNVVYIKNVTSTANARMVIPLVVDGKKKILDTGMIQHFISTPNLAFDMHIHTTNSDGVLTTKQLLEEVKDAGLDFISITDHNSIKAYDDIRKVKLDKSKMAIIPGAEINSIFDGYRLEILAYDFDVDKFRHFKHLNPGVRLEYYKKQLEDLKRVADTHGLKYSKNLQPSPNVVPPCTLYLDLIKYEENSKFFKSNKITQKAQFCREFCYRKGSMFYVDDYGTPSVQEVCDYIHMCGGVAVLAHIYNYRLEKTEANALLDKLISLDCLDGVEVMYASYTKDDVEYLKKVCKKHGLIRTGGSDYHRPKRMYDDVEYDNYIGYLPVMDENLNTNDLK